MKQHEIYMQRCIELARLGAGSVAPNPMVGAVLVYKDRIIGEGYHMQYGQAHAEVNCIQAVTAEDACLLSSSVLYVSLEPCAHHGKTPPCADLIIAKKIPTVIIGCRDPFTEVDGKGIEKLKAAGVEVILPVMETACKELNERFITFHTKHRPYIVLKWAQTANNIIGNKDHSRLLISHELTNRLVHKWRSEEAAILIATNTALYDNPSLTTRLWKGKNPVRMVLDMHLRLPVSLHLLDASVNTIVFNGLRSEEQNNLLYYQLMGNGSMAKQLCEAMYKLNIQSVLVEGGAMLLQAFIDEGMFDEARVIVSDAAAHEDGVTPPVIKGGVLQSSMQLQSDCIRFYRHGL